MQARLKERPPVLIKDLESSQILGPFPLITWGRGYACVSTDKGPRWIPVKNIKPYLQPLQEHQDDPQEKPQKKSEKKTS